MTTAEELKEARKELDSKIEKLLKEFIIKYGNMYLKIEANTYFSQWDHGKEMHCYSRTEITL